MVETVHSDFEVSHPSLHRFPQPVLDIADNLKPREDKARRPAGLFDL